MTPPSSKIGRNKSSSNDRHHHHHDTVTEEEETATATFYETTGIATAKDDNGYNDEDDNTPVNHIATPITDTPHATPNRNTLTPSTSSVGRGSSNASSYSYSNSNSKSQTNNNNNYYSAPHTPIASAKRPRNPYSSRRSTGATKNKVTHGNYTGTSFATENDTPSSSLSISSKAWNLLGGGGGGGGKYRSSIGGSDSGRSSGRSASGSGSATASVHAGGEDTLPDQEEAVLSSVMSPVRKMKLVGDSSSRSSSSNSPSANVSVIDATATTSLPMSPMHPVRPVTKYDKDVTMPNHTGVKISSLYQEEWTKDGGVTHDVNSVVDGVVVVGAATATTTTTTGNMNQSSSPSVLKSIFSPVLNFLNHSSTKDKDVAASIAVVDENKHKDKHAARQKHTRHEVDLDGDVCMHMQGEGDTMEDVLEDSGADANIDIDPDADRSTLTLPVVDNHSNNNSNNNRVHVEDDDYGHFTATSPTVDSHQDEISVQDQEELDIEEEFNPYLFIKYLPPYETVVCENMCLVGYIHRL